MATRTITAQAVIKAQDQTSGVFAKIEGRARAMMRSLSAMSGGVGSAGAVRARANEAARQAGQISARNRARADAWLGRGLGIDPYTVGGALAGVGIGKSVTTFADDERRMTRIGNIVNATREQMRETMGDAYKLAINTAQPFGKVVEGMETLASQGRSLQEVRDFIPSVARSAQAAGAEIADIAKSADAVSTHLKVPAEQMQDAFDIMAAAGKAGQFELKDMARYLPSMLPAAKALGIEGTKGLRDITAMLQVIRQGTGTAEEAASSMQNIFAKMESEETTKRFKKFGIDLRKEMTAARKEGKNLLEVFEDLTNKAVKGDLSKIPQLFSDMEFARGMRALLAQRGKWQEMAGEIERTAPGTTNRDLRNVLADTQASLDQFSQSARRAASGFGEFASTLLGPGMKLLGELGEEIGKVAQRAREDAASIPDEKKNEYIATKLDSIINRLNGTNTGIPYVDQAMQENIRKANAEAEKRKSFDTGGKGFRGAAFGFGAGGISPRAYRGSIVGGYDPDIPLPPPRPAGLGGTPRAPQASSSEDIRRAIEGAPALGKLEAVVTAPVTAQLTGSANVAGQVAGTFTVVAGSSLIALEQQMKTLMIDLKGALNAGNGPGSTGKSSPDAAAGGTGAQ